MEKSIPSVHQKRSSPKQHPKTNKKPLKVVYITNPIKFKATASEFRALVQELTGQDADMSDSSIWFSGGTSNVEEAKVATEENAMHRNGSDQPGFETSYDDVYYKQEMMDGFGLGLVSCHEASSHVDSYRSFDAL